MTQFPQLTFYYHLSSRHVWGHGSSQVWLNLKSGLHQNWLSWKYYTVSQSAVVFTPQHEVWQPHIFTLSHTSLKVSMKECCRAGLDRSALVSSQNCAWSRVVQFVVFPTVLWMKNQGVWFSVTSPADWIYVEHSEPSMCSVVILHERRNTKCFNLMNTVAQLRTQPQTNVKYDSAYKKNTHLHGSFHSHYSFKTMNESRLLI